MLEDRALFEAFGTISSPDLTLPGEAVNCGDYIFLSKKSRKYVSKFRDISKISPINQKKGMILHVFCLNPASFPKNVFELNTQKTQSKVVWAIHEPPLPGTLPAAMTGCGICLLPIETFPGFR